MITTLSIRIDDDLKRRFTEKLEEKNESARDKIVQWISYYLNNAAVTTEEESERTKDFDERFLAYGITSEHFTLQHRPAPLYVDEMDFSWLFQKDNLRTYLIERAGESINKVGWTLNMWLWSFIWMWRTTFGIDKPIDSTDLQDRWFKGEEPVESFVALGARTLKDSETMKPLLTAYAEDEEKYRW